MNDQNIILEHKIRRIEITLLSAHPLNRPATGINREQVATLKAIISENGYNANKPLTVRKYGDGYQIVEGHHRWTAARELGFTEIPCVIEELSDAEANLRMLTSNQQEGNSPLDIGLNALATIVMSEGGRGNNGGLREYAKQIGKGHGYVSQVRQAAEVFQVVTAQNGRSTGQFLDKSTHLAEIHAASCWLWPALAHALQGENWTVEVARKKAQSLKDIPESPLWTDREKIAQAVVAGHMRAGSIAEFEEYRKKTENKLSDPDLLAEFRIAFDGGLMFATLSDLVDYCRIYIDKQAEVDRLAREQEVAKRREVEAANTRALRLQKAISLEEWHTLKAEEQRALLSLNTNAGLTFNKQENADVEWAQFSWNSITGCLHSCSYCYARDIANQTRMAKVYPYGFAPTLHAARLLAPQNQKPPKQADTDMRYRNVFVGSMADIWGRWVPKEWIEAVLAQVKAAPEWNFLFLTKFPKRMAEFKYPKNCWLGTTVDLQIRVAAAEKAFASVEAPIKWLSIEPMLEPLKFKRLDLFDWIVIGESSPSSKTPEWKPPVAWVLDLVNQARAANVKVYFKSNLLGNPTRILELPFDMPVTQDVCQLPDVFHYLKGEASAE